MAARFATLDVGTNTVLLLVAEAAGGQFRPVLERAEITRLGRGVDRTGRLAPEAIDQTVGAIARFAAEARALGASDIACVATSASRDARNGAEFLARVRREAGLQAEIITGDLEAELAYASAARELGEQTPLGVLDIGGGSTELVFGERGRVRFKRSFDLGSVRLSERFAQHDPPTAEERGGMERLLAESFARLPPPPAHFRLVGIAGTVTTIAAVARGVDPYDAARVHRSTLSRAEVGRELERYFAATVEQRRAMRGMHPKRADVIPAGTLILATAMDRLGAGEVIVSDRGVRWGLLYHRFANVLAGE